MCVALAGSDDGNSAARERRTREREREREIASDHGRLAAAVRVYSAHICSGAAALTSFSGLPISSAAIVANFSLSLRNIAASFLKHAARASNPAARHSGNAACVWSTMSPASTLEMKARSLMSSPVAGFTLRVVELSARRISEARIIAG